MLALIELIDPFVSPIQALVSMFVALVPVTISIHDRHNVPPVVASLEAWRKCPDGKMGDSCRKSRQDDIEELSKKLAPEWQMVFARVWAQRDAVGRANAAIAAECVLTNGARPGCEMGGRR